MTDMREPTAVATAIACLECGQLVDGAHCRSCGQRVQSPIKPFGTFVMEGLSEILSLDGPQLRSIRVLVTRPGALTVEYLNGRRTRYVHPVRLFVQVGIAAFLITRLIPTESSLFGVGPELFGDDASVTEGLAAAALIPVGAGAHWLALRSARPFLVEHFVFTLHVMAFSFLLAPVEGALFFTTHRNPWLETVSALVAPIVWGVYWILALQRFTSASLRESVLHAVRVYVWALLITAPLFVYQLLSS